MKKFILTSSLLLFTTFFVTTEVTAHNTFKIFYSSFAHVNVNRVMHITCDSTTSANICKEIKKEARDIEKKISSSGSAVVISHRNKTTYLLTAAHICDNDFWTQKTFIANSKGVKFKYSVTTRAIVTSFKGKKSFTFITKKDKSFDICMLQSPGVFGKPIVLAKTMPKMGSIIYNLGAPLGVFSPGMVPTFSGHYSGIYQNHSLQTFSKFFVGKPFFSFGVTNGSSGGAIFNKKGEMISLVSAFPRQGNMQFQHLAIGVNLKEIRKFVKANLPK